MKRLSHTLCTKSILAVSLLSLFSGQAVSAEGEADTIALDPIARSYLLSNNGKEASFSEKGISKEDSKSVGIDVVTSESANLYSIPVAYGKPIQLLGGEEYINLSADIPYINAEAPAGGENGLGDVGLAVEYFIEKESIIFKAEASMKLPTGDEKVGLGTGSTDLGMAFTGRKRMEQIGFNATMGYILRGETTISGQDIDYGNVITLAGGAEYRLQKDLWVGANLAYVHAGTTDNEGFKIDGLQTLDLIPNISYRVNSDITITADLILPVQESVIDGDFPFDAPDREISFSFGFNSEF